MWPIGSARSLILAKREGPCAAEGCDRAQIALGYCQKHYVRFKRWGPTLRRPEITTTCASANCTANCRSDRNRFCDTHARRNRTIKHFYGIDLLEYERIRDSQNGRCATCGKEALLHLDHCHETGRVRSMLCGNCNRALGLVAESPETLRAMLAYVEGR